VFIPILILLFSLSVTASDLKREAAQLVSSDRSGILSLQLRLTQHKLSQSPGISGLQSNLKTLDAKQPQILKRLVELYKRHHSGQFPKTASELNQRDQAIIWLSHYLMQDCSKDTRSCRDEMFSKSSVAPIMNENVEAFESILRLLENEELMCGGKKYQGGNRIVIKHQPRPVPVDKLVDNLFRSASFLGVCRAKKLSPSVEYEQRDKLVCCASKPEWMKRHRFTLYGGGADFSCRAFYGVPYISEVGVKIGVDVKFGLAGTKDPVTCKKDQFCVLGNFPINVRAALYGDLLSGGASLQGGLKWIPRLQAQQCFSEDKSKQPFNLLLRVGYVELLYEVSGSWGLFVYEGSHNIHESTKVQKASLYLF
jgi:hypothetical protein